MRVEHSRLLQIRDFRSGNYLILGDAWSNPWSSLFQERFNFRFEQEPGGSYVIHNLKPNPGERKLYTTSAQEARDGVSYATVAGTRNLSGSGTVVIAAGLYKEANEGKFDALLSPAPPALLQAGDFELLFEVRARGGVASGIRVLASRLPPATR